MPLRIVCPSCAKTYTVGDEQRGRIIHCLECGRVIGIPKAASPPSQPRPPAKPPVSGVKPGSAPPKPAAQPPKPAPPPKPAAPPPKPTSSVSKAPPPKEAVQPGRPQPRPNAAANVAAGAPKPRPRPAVSDSSPRSIRKPAGTGIPKSYLIGGAVGLVALILIVAVVIGMNRSGDKPQQVAQNPPNTDKQGQENPNPNPNPTPNPDPTQKLSNPTPTPVPTPVPVPTPTPTPAPQPQPKPKPADLKPLPDQIAADTVKRVKQATVYLHVKCSTGGEAEGSGFLAVEPGIVVTNAHVLGMLSPSSRPPTQVDVVVHSGEANEFKLVGQVLGVDRTNDLAVVRVQGTLPQPLQLDIDRELIETQKVYIFGFPFGKELGKNITVSDSSVSSLRKNATGALEQIQVNGGMHPGNSGGPVVNSAGQLIGVSVAGIRGTQINFAVPAEFVKLILDGRILESKHDEPYLVEGQARLPVQFTCLDAFGRVKETRVEVWAGNPGKERPAGLTPPQPQSGDGQRLSYTLSYANSIASGDVLWPKLESGQVLWIQPVAVSSTGMVQWGTARATEAGLAPIERKAANLLVKQTTHKERTIHMKTTQSQHLIKGNKKRGWSDKAELNVVELIGDEPRGAVVKLGFGPAQLSFEQDGQNEPLDPDVAKALTHIPPTFVIDPTNRLVERGDINLSPKLPEKLRRYITDYFNEICNGYESTTLNLPNREVQAKETWPTKLGMLIKMERKIEVVDLMLQCTYEGQRTRNGRAEAVLSVTGKVQGRGNIRGKIDGNIQGKFGFDLADGYFATAKLSITSEADVAEGLQVVTAFEVNLTRSPGNPHKIERPGGAPLGTVKGDVIAKDNGFLGPNDAFDQEIKGSRMKPYTLKFEEGKKYSIQLNSNQFDAYLRLAGPNGNVIAKDDDSGGGLNARIDFTCTVSGVYTIAVTSFNGKGGQFQLTVLEVK